jgi:SAM-dependent methyltransferase
MTDTIDLVEFWNQEHTAHSGWLTGTSWQAMKQYYGITDRDVQGKCCLEIGVGKATVTRELARLAEKLYCCDISSAALAKVKDLSTESWLTQDLAQAPPVDVV